MVGAYCSLLANDSCILSERLPGAAAELLMNVLAKTNLKEMSAQPCGTVPRTHRDFLRFSLSK